MFNTDEKIGELFNEYYVTDDESTERKGYMLRTYYEQADDDEKKLFDKIMIAICGYSMETTIKDAKNEVEVWLVVDVNGKKIGEFVDEDDAYEYANTCAYEECSVQRGGNHEW